MGETGGEPSMTVPDSWGSGMLFIPRGRETKHGQKYLLQRLFIEKRIADSRLRICKWFRNTSFNISHYLYNSASLVKSFYILYVLFNAVYSSQCTYPVYIVYIFLYLLVFCIAFLQMYYFQWYIYFQFLLWPFPEYTRPLSGPVDLMETIAWSQWGKYGGLERKLNALQIQKEPSYIWW